MKRKTKVYVRIAMQFVGLLLVLGSTQLFRDLPEPHNKWMMIPLGIGLFIWKAA